MDGRPEEEFHDQVVTDARSTLGEEAFVAAWECGQAMTPEEIVDGLRR